MCNNNELYAAIQDGDIIKVREFIANGYSVKDIPYYVIVTALHNGHNKMVEYLQMCTHILLDDLSEELNKSMDIIENINSQYTNNK